MTDEQKVVWQGEVSHPELAEAARDALREVIDPEIGLNVVELGLIRDVIIEEEKAHVRMIMTTPFCPYGPALLETARQKTEKRLDRPTTIEVGTEMWDPSMMEEGAGADWGFF